MCYGFFISYKAQRLKYDITNEGRKLRIGQLQ